MKRTTQVIAAVCAALALASCGGDDGEPISQKRADRLDSLLQQVQRQSDAGSCTTLLEATIPALEKQADALPESVGGDTKETITDGVAHLRDLAETDCAEKQQEELPTTDESTTTTEPSTTTTTREESTTTTEPSTYSMQKYACPSAVPTSWTVTMFGCWSRAAASASRRKRATKASSSARCSARSFTATGRSSTSSVARNTVDIPPAPRRRLSA